MLSLARRHGCRPLTRVLLSRSIVGGYDHRLSNLMGEKPPVEAADATGAPHSVSASTGSVANASRTGSEHFIRSDTKPYFLHIKATHNNTITTFANPEGNVIAWASGGSCGFKHVQRSTYEAGYQCALRMFIAIEKVATEEAYLKVELVYKGFGKGREAVTEAIVGNEGAKIREYISKIGDRTPIKVGGTKAKKTRRL